MQNQWLRIRASAALRTGCYCCGFFQRARSARGREDFYAFNDLRRPIHALYLTHATLDEPFFSEMYGDSRASQELTWGRFAVDSALRSDLPPGFPLRHAPAGYLERGHFFLTDRVRWKKASQ